MKRSLPANVPTAPRPLALLLLLSAGCGIMPTGHQGAVDPTSATSTAPAPAVDVPHVDPATDPNATSKPANPNMVPDPTDPGVVVAPPADPTPVPPPPPPAPADSFAAAPVLASGRFSRDGNSLIFAWPNSLIQANFSGTGLTVRLKELNGQLPWGKGPPSGNFYDVSIDGAKPVKLMSQPGEVTYPLASNLPAGNHTVSLRKRTEARVGAVQFLGFGVTAGALLPSPAPLGRRIEIIGDSISAGYGDEGLDAHCAYTPQTENVAVSYGVVAAEQLQAEATVLAWAGKGVFRNSSADPSPETMPILYQRTLPATGSSRWDFSQPPADVVVINLGTNDFDRGNPLESDFKGAYLSLIANVRSHYPMAHIYCALGPMLSDTVPKGQQALTTSPGVHPRRGGCQHRPARALPRVFSRQQPGGLPGASQRACAGGHGRAIGDGHQAAAGLVNSGPDVTGPTFAA